MSEYTQLDIWKDMDIYRDEPEAVRKWLSIGEVAFAGGGPHNAEHPGAGGIKEKFHRARPSTLTR